MNAMYRASMYRAMDIRNESHLIFTKICNGQTKIKKLTDSNQIISNHKSIFFVNEGRVDFVIRVRVKSRKTINTDIITSMQTILYEKYRRKKDKVVGN